MCIRDSAHAAYLNATPASKVVVEGNTDERGTPEYNIALGQRLSLIHIFSVLTMAGVIITAAVSMFPFVMPSSTHPEQSLLMWDATSSPVSYTHLDVYKRQVKKMR